MQNQSLTVIEILEINPPTPTQNPAQNPEEPRQKGKPFLCRHIFADGRRCGSYALRVQHFCYYHQTHRIPVLAGQRRRQPASGFDLTRMDGLDNPTAIQLTLAEVLARVANNSIDRKTAWLLLYGLQIAARNLRHPRSDKDVVADAIVEDHVHGQLAELEEGRIVPESHLDRLRSELEQTGRLNEPGPDFEPRSPDLTPCGSRL